MLKRLPVDTFLLALLAVVALAALFPASGTIGDVLSVATKVAIALLFFLYGARLSPTEALHGLRHWQLHLLVLAATFVAFPLLGLAARGLVPSVLTPDLYTGVLFLCLVPSTVQSSIAFTSIPHGNVLTPLLVVLLMHTTGAPRIDGSAVLDIVVQLLLPFIAGQLLRPWLAPWVHRHALVTKAFDPARRLHRFLDEHHRTRLEHGEPVAGGGVAGVCTALLAVMLGVTVGISRLASLNRADAAVVLFCGSKKSLASGLPMALVFFGTGAVGLIMLPLIIFHQIQLFACAVIASRMSRTVPAT